MQTANPANCEHDNIVPWVLWPRHPHVSFSDACEKSVELHTYHYLKNPSGRRNFILTCTENSSCVESISIARSLGHRVGGELSDRNTSRQESYTGAACANVLSKLQGGNRRCHLLSWVLKVAREDSSRHRRQRRTPTMRKQFVQKTHLPVAAAIR